MPAQYAAGRTVRVKVASVGRNKRSALRGISVSARHARLSTRLAPRRNVFLHGQHAAKARLHAPDATHRLAADPRSRGAAYASVSQSTAGWCWKRSAVAQLAAGDYKEAVTHHGHLNARERVRVEHPVRVITRPFGHRVVRHRGRANNAAQLLTLFAPSNQWMTRKALLATAGQVRGTGGKNPGNGPRTARHGPNIGSPSGHGGRYRHFGNLTWGGHMVGLDRSILMPAPCSPPHRGPSTAVPLPDAAAARASAPAGRARNGASGQRPAPGAPPAWD